MGSTRERIGSDGSVRYTALYRDLKGRQRSAGTFTTQRQADRAWPRAESKVAQGQLGEPVRGRQTFRDYVEKTWLPNHEIEATTRQSYGNSRELHQPGEKPQVSRSQDRRNGVPLILMPAP